MDHALNRTRKAIAEHDRAFLAGRLDDLEALGEAVGVAYGEDTRGLNDLETCRKCVRPGHPNPPPGYETSFVRRMVLKAEDPAFREACAKDYEKYRKWHEEMFGEAPCG